MSQNFSNLPIKKEESEFEEISFEDESNSLNCSSSQVFICYSSYERAKCAK